MTDLDHCAIGGEEMTGRQLGTLTDVLGEPICSEHLDECDQAATQEGTQ